MKKILVIFIFIALVLVEGYLIMSSYLDKANANNELQSYCAEKCDYNTSSSMWEFSASMPTKGFATKEECFSYCAKVKQGFVASFLNSVLKIIKK